MAVGFYMLGTHPNTHEFAKISQPPVVFEKKMDTHSSQKIEALTEPLTPSIATSTEVKAGRVINVPTKSNEQIVWNRLIKDGFTREQAAGIMGNLQQEHKFKTSDTAGGLGIVQWIGNRRANLMARDNHTNINVQLDFLMEELRGVEHRALARVKATTTIEGATIAFQNGFERCGRCNQTQRIAYAYNFYGRF